MWLFDEFLQNEVQQNVYQNKSNKKIKKEKKRRIEFEDRLLSKKELQYKHKLEQNRAYWHKRVADNQEFNKQMYAERDEYWREYPIPLTTPNEIDNLYLNHYAQDIGGIRYVGNYWIRYTAIWNWDWLKYFDITCPIKLIYSLGLERRYNQWMDIQVEIAKFLKDRHNEIKRNYTRNHTRLITNNWTGWVTYKTISHSWCRQIVNEWKAIYGTRGVDMMMWAVKDIYRYWYWSPLVWLHWIGPSYLIGDVMYDWFGHCDYISNFWNPKDYIEHRQLLHTMAFAARDPKLKKEKKEKIPYFRMSNPIIIRIPSNGIEIRQEGQHYSKWRPEPDTLLGKSNNGEWDYYWVSLQPYRPFPSWSDIQNKFWIDDTKFTEGFRYNTKYHIQPACKYPHNLYLREM